RDTPPALHSFPTRRSSDLLRSLSGVGALSNAAFLADRRITHALVLGASGFLGAPLVRRLCAAGVRTTCLLHRRPLPVAQAGRAQDRKSTRLNSSHRTISYA